MGRAFVGGVALAVASCGRIGFAPGVDGDGGDPADSLRSSLEVASATCTSTVASLAPSRDIATGETLMALLVMREPDAVTTPTISGSSTWITDASFATSESINRRYVALFRSVVAAPILAGESIDIQHPSARATGVVLLAFPNAIQLTTPATAAEGDVLPISASYTSMSPTTACIVAHPNNSTMAFDPGWSPLLDLQPQCGGNRESAGVHVALTQATGTVMCSGSLSNESLSWAAVLVGYADLL